jgi:polar amino acid transport system substrate-binding protein
MVGLRLRTLLAGLVVLIVCADAAAAQECHVAALAGNPGWAPFSVTDTGGQLSDAGYDIARAALASLGVESRIGESQPWNRVLASLEAWRVDLVVSAYRDAERSRRFLYTDACADDPTAVFTRATASFPVAGLADLAGRTGVVSLGSNFGAEIAGFLHDNPAITVNDSREGMFRQLLTTRVDYAILSQRNGEHILARLGLAGTIVPAPHPLAVNPVYMILSRQSPCAGRLGALNNALAALRRDGTIDRLIAAAESS